MNESKQLSFDAMVSAVKQDDNTSGSNETSDAIIPTGSDAAEVVSDEVDGAEAVEECPLRPNDQRPVVKLSVKLIDTYKFINKVLNV